MRHDWQDECEDIEREFDRTWHHRKMSWGMLHLMGGCDFCPPWCCEPYAYQFKHRGVRHRWMNKRRKWGKHNSKRKTLRTHRDGKSRK